jgi:hypothetical protein
MRVNAGRQSKIQLMSLWILSVLFLFKTMHNNSGIRFCFLQVEPTQLGPVDRANPYLWT